MVKQEPELGVQTHSDARHLASTESKTIGRITKGNIQQPIPSEAQLYIFFQQLS